VYENEENDMNSKIVIDPAIAAQINDLMQSGYRYLEKKQFAPACVPWQKAWQLISSLLHQYPDASVEAIDGAFHGHQSISNWSSDYETGLANAALDNPSFYKICIDFCRAYVARSQDPGSVNNLNHLQAIAESHFRMGLPREGEASFLSLIRLYPRYAWGWIGWADQYSFYTKDPWYNLEKAENILRQALDIDGIGDRREILDRLRNILTRQGRTIEASLI
jgi:tetratricopeptide (TPR) repeat protein